MGEHFEKIRASQSLELSLFALLCSKIHLSVLCYTLKQKKKNTKILRSKFLVGCVEENLLSLMLKKEEEEI